MKTYKWKTSNRIGLVNKVKWACKIAQAANKARNTNIRLHLLDERLHGKLKPEIVANPITLSLDNEENKKTNEATILSKCLLDLKTLKRDMLGKQISTSYSSFYSRLVSLITPLVQETDPGATLL